MSRYIRAFSILIFCKHDDTFELHVYFKEASAAKTEEQKQPKNSDSESSFRISILFVHFLLLTGNIKYYSTLKIIVILTTSTHLFIHVSPVKNLHTFLLQTGKRVGNLNIVNNNSTIFNGWCKLQVAGHCLTIAETTQPLLMLTLGLNTIL